MKRLGTTIVGAGVLLVLGTACANPQETDAGGQGSNTSVTAPPSSTAPEGTPDRQPARTPPNGGTLVATEKVDSSALPKSYPKLVWTEGDGKTIGAVAQEGGCGKASLEVTEQSAAQVKVNLVETQPATPKACTMDLRYPKLTGELTEPLGDRTIVLTKELRKS